MNIDALAEKLEYNHYDSASMDVILAAFANSMRREYHKHNRPFTKVILNHERYWRELSKKTDGVLKIDSYYLLLKIIGNQKFVNFCHTRLIEEGYQ